MVDGTVGKLLSPLTNIRVVYGSGGYIHRWIAATDDLTAEKGKGLTGGDVTGEGPPILNFFVWAWL